MAKTATKGSKRSKKTDRGAYASLAMFDLRLGDEGLFRVKFEGVPLAGLRHLTTEDYEPHGSTPLRDATMEMIHLGDRLAAERPDAVQVLLLVDETGSMREPYGPGTEAVVTGLNQFVDGIRDVEPDDSGGRVLCVVMTDGEENASRRTSAQELQGAIAEREATNWTFIYLGANQDAWDQGTSLGNSGGLTGQTVAYASTPRGTVNAMSAIAQDAAGYVGEHEQFKSSRMASSVRTITEDGDEIAGDASGSKVNAKPEPKAKPYGDVDDAVTRATKGGSK